GGVRFHDLHDDPHEVQRVLQGDRAGEFWGSGAEDLRGVVRRLPLALVPRDEVLDPRLHYEPDPGAVLGGKRPVPREAVIEPLQRGAGEEVGPASKAAHQLLGGGWLRVGHEALGHACQDTAQLAMGCGMSTTTGVAQSLATPVVIRPHPGRNPRQASPPAVPVVPACTSCSWYLLTASATLLASLLPASARACRVRVTIECVSMRKCQRTEGRVSEKPNPSAPRV